MNAREGLDLIIRQRNSFAENPNQFEELQYKKDAHQSVSLYRCKSEAPYADKTPTREVDVVARTIQQTVG